MIMQTEDTSQIYFYSSTLKGKKSQKEKQVKQINYCSNEKVKKVITKACEEKWVLKKTWVQRCERERHFQSLGACSATGSAPIGLHPEPEHL